MRMVVTMTNGTTREVFLPVTKIVSDPLDRTRTIAKFKAITEGVVGSNRQTAIIDAMLGLEALPSMDRLVELLAPAVAAAF